jgi:hypothetical protein
MARGFGMTAGLIFLSINELCRDEPESQLYRESRIHPPQRRGERMHRHGGRYLMVLGW